MRFTGLKRQAHKCPLLTAICLLSTLAACKGENKATTGETTGAAAATESAGMTGAAAGGLAAAPITGKTIEVKMVGDSYDPANFTVSVGDGAKFTNISGGPHDVAFWADSIPAGAAAQLQANMPNTTSPLTGPILTIPNQTYTISFGGLKPGVYHYYCTPHLATGMKGVITVQ